MIVHVVTPRRCQSGSVDVDDFTGLSAPCVSVVWGEGGLDVEFGGDLSGGEVAAVRRFCESVNDVEVELRELAAAAAATNRNFRDTVAPQIEAGVAALLADPAASPQEKDLARGLRAVANQTLALTRQSLVVGRLVLGQLDAVD